MEKIIEYLNTGNCIALIGAGPSCELGLPTWQELTEILLEIIKIKKIRGIELYESFLKQKKYPEFFGSAIEDLGEDFVYKFYEEHTKDNYKNGRVYRFLSKFPFQAYFTTNFDDCLLRHLNEEKISSKVFLNRKEDLEEVDIDILKKTLVKIHGDFSETQTLVLTDKQYLDRESSGDFQYYRDFIRSYLSTKRFIIIGYSVSDPDIQRILKDISANLRRTVPIYAVIADAESTLVREWDKKYNIHIISYKNKSGKHTELANIFSALENYISLDSTAPAPRPEIELKMSQSFYMWHKFQVGDDTIKFKVDALKSIILYVVCHEKSKNKYTIDEIMELMYKLLGLGLQPEKKEIEETLLSLVQEKYFQITHDKQFERTEATLETIDKYNRQYDNLISTFVGQVELDFSSIDLSLQKKEKDEVVKATKDVIVDLFMERGIELVNMVFSNSRINTVQAKSLFRLIHSRSKSISRVNLQYAFIQYITKLLSAPTDLQKNVLEYYSKSYFAMQALQVDPLGQKFRNEYLKNRTFIVDSNIMIPLLSISSKDNKIFESIISRAKDCNVKLITTERLILEVIDHAKWALNLVQKYGEQSEELLSAALGREPYKRNLFIDGFINYATDIKKISFEQYLNLVIHDYRSADDVSKILQDKYSIKIFNNDALFNQGNDAFYQRDKLYEFIRNKALGSGIEKSTPRALVEAEAYTIIYYWSTFKPKDVSEEDWNCSFMSQGGFLNRIASESDFKLTKNIVVKIDALYEFLMRYSTNFSNEISFSDVLLSSYFKSAEYFIDKKKYSSFFRPLINEAERIYKEGVEEFKEHVNNKLTTSSLDDYFDLEKPIVVKAYEEQLKEKLSIKEDKIKELEKTVQIKDEKLKDTQEKLDKYVFKERNMKRYAEKQRRAQARKKGKGK